MYHLPKKTDYFMINQLINIDDASDDYSEENESILT